MSLSPFDSFQSRFVTYLLNFPPILTSYRVGGYSGALETEASNYITQTLLQ